MSGPEVWESSDCDAEGCRLIAIKCDDGCVCAKLEDAKRIAKQLNALLRKVAARPTVAK